MAPSFKVNKLVLSDDAARPLSSRTRLSASQVASNIDILIEILSRLPVKSVLMFKSVSKHWLTLMSDSHFIYKHFTQNPHPPAAAGIFALDNIKGSEVKFFFLDEGRNSHSSGGGGGGVIVSYFNSLVPKIKILQSCNGLLLCRSGKLHLYPNGNNPNNYLNYYIWNPCTSQCKTLSSLPRFPLKFCEPINGISASLAFDPLKSPHYKLVWIWNGAQIHIYCSATDTWRLSNYQLDASKNIRRESGVFWNGSLNWVFNNYSICFVIDQEMAKRVPLPQISDRPHVAKETYLRNCNGQLYCLKSYDKRLTNLDILGMSTDFSVWNIKYCLDLKPLAKGILNNGLNNYFYFYSAGAHCFRVLVVQEEEDHLKLVVHIPNGQVVSYNTKEMKLKEIHNLGPEFSRYVIHIAYHQFMESLAHV